MAPEGSQRPANTATSFSSVFWACSGHIYIIFPIFLHFRVVMFGARASALWPSIPGLAWPGLAWGRWQCRAKPGDFSRPWPPGHLFHSKFEGRPRYLAWPGPGPVAVQGQAGVILPALFRPGLAWLGPCITILGGGGEGGQHPKNVF